MVDKREHPSKALDDVGRTTHRTNETTISRRLEFNRRKICHVHRICLMLRHPLKLRRHQWSSGDLHYYKRPKEGFENPFLTNFATFKFYPQQSKLLLLQWYSNSTASPSPPAPNASPSSYTRKTSPSNSIPLISQLVNINRPSI